MSINVLQAKHLISKLPMTDHASLLKGVKRLDSEERKIVRQAFEVAQFGEKAKATLHSNRIEVIVGKMTQEIPADKKEKSTIAKCFESFCRGLQNLLGLRIGSDSLVHFIEKHRNVVRLVQNRAIQGKTEADLWTELEHLNKGITLFDEYLKLNRWLYPKLMKQNELPSPEAATPGYFDLLKNDPEFSKILLALETEENPERDANFRTAYFKLFSRAGVVQGLIKKLIHEKELNQVATEKKLEEEGKTERLGRLKKLHAALKNILQNMDSSLTKQEAYLYARRELLERAEQCDHIATVLCEGVPLHLHERRLTELKKEFSRIREALKLDSSTSIYSQLEHEYNHNAALLRLPLSNEQRVEVSKEAEMELINKQTALLAAPVASPQSRAEEAIELVGRLELKRAILFTPVLKKIEEGKTFSKEDLQKFVLGIVGGIEENPATFCLDLSSGQDFRVYQLKLDLLHWILTVRMPVKADVEKQLWLSQNTESGLRRRIPGLVELENSAWGKELSQLAIIRDQFLRPLYERVKATPKISLAYYTFSILEPHLKKCREEFPELEYFFKDYETRDFSLNVVAQLGAELNAIDLREAEIRRLYQA